MSERKRGRPIEWSSSQYKARIDEDAFTREQILKVRAEKDAEKA